MCLHNGAGCTCQGKDQRTTSLHRGRSSIKVKGQAGPVQGRRKHGQLDETPKIV